MIVLVVYTSKGGAGKTVTAVNLATLWAQRYRVLLVDVDPQYSATTFFLSDAPQPLNIYHALFEGVPIEEIMMQPKEGLPNLYVVPSGEEMENAARQLPDLPNPDRRLARALRHVDDFDICIIDCPGTYNAINKNAFMAGTHLLVPVNTERQAYNGAVDTLRRSDEMRSEYDEDPLPYRVLVADYAGHTNNARTMAEAIEGTWPGHVCKTYIRSTVRVPAMASTWSTVVDEKDGPALEDHTALAQELETWFQL